jgi:hypothetical protein
LETSSLKYKFKALAVASSILRATTHRDLSVSSSNTTPSLPFDPVAEAEAEAEAEAVAVACFLSSTRYAGAL